MNVHAYTLNPTGGIDPLGLATQKPKSSKGNNASCQTPASRQEVITNTAMVVKMYEPALKAIDPDMRVGIRGSTALGSSPYKGTSWTPASDIDGYIASKKLPAKAYGPSLPDEIKGIESAIDKQLKLMMPCNGKKGQKLFSFKVQPSGFPEGAARRNETIVPIF